MCKPPEGAVFKRHGAEGSGKRYRITVSGECKEAERKWIVEDLSKGISCWQNYWHRCADRVTVADNCLLATGQPALRRQELYTGFYSERERLPYWCAKRFAGIPVLPGRLFNKSSTIHTVTQSCLRQEMQQGASDEVIVVRIFRESGE
jgi:hypothetical protein